jgi:hypothetical protein
MAACRPAHAYAQAHVHAVRVEGKVESGHGGRVRHSANVMGWTGLSMKARADVLGCMLPAACSPAATLQRLKRAPALATAPAALPAPVPTAVPAPVPKPAPVLALVLATAPTPPAPNPAPSGYNMFDYSTVPEDMRDTAARDPVRGATGRGLRVLSCVQAAAQRNPMHACRRTTPHTCRPRGRIGSPRSTWQTRCVHSAFCLNPPLPICRTLCLCNLPAAAHHRLMQSAQLPVRAD